MEKEIIYLYCVTDKTPALKDIAHLTNKLRPISYNGLYAIAGKVKKDEFSVQALSKNLANLRWIKAKANLHEKVIEGIMKKGSVIPFKFPTLFNSEDNLKKMLKKHAQKFQVHLKGLAGKEEWGIKIYCDMDKLRKALIREDKESLNIDKEINASTPGKAYFLKKKKLGFLDTSARKKISEYGQDSFDSLSRQSVKAQINKLLPKEVTEREDDMVLNSAFLVDKKRIKEFIKIVYNLNSKYKDKGLEFNCTGPWPPYNFCEKDE